MYLKKLSTIIKQALTEKPLQSYDQFVNSKSCFSKSHFLKTKDFPLIKTEKSNYEKQNFEKRDFDN